MPRPRLEPREATNNAQALPERLGRWREVRRGPPHEALTGSHATAPALEAGDFRQSQRGKSKKSRPRGIGRQRRRQDRSPERPAASPSTRRNRPESHLTSCATGFAARFPARSMLFNAQCRCAAASRPFRASLPSTSIATNAGVGCTDSRSAAGQDQVGSRKIVHLRFDRIIECLRTPTSVGSPVQRAITRPTPDRRRKRQRSDNARQVPATGRSRFAASPTGPPPRCRPAH